MPELINADYQKNFNQLDLATSTHHRFRLCRARLRKLSRGPANFGRILEGMGVPQPNLVAWITSVFEFTGGASIIAGAFVVPLALPLSLIMLTAMFKIHFQYGFSSVRLKSIT